MTELRLQRLGLLMEPEPNNPMEAEGVLNPAAVRGKDGNLYLFPRIVAKGNYSRIGICRVLFNNAGDPCGVERIGIALEPETDHEKRSDGSGGCEDPRITFVEPLRHYVMTYTALSPKGPRIALAISEDIFSWRRLGLVTFLPYEGIEFGHVDNKDACVFPLAIPDPSGKPALALLHRPLFPGTRPEEKVRSTSGTSDARRESIWISYRDIDIKGREPYHLCHFTSHTQLAAPAAPWERLKIGCGAPPVLTPQGWLVVYHGVSQFTESVAAPPRMRYSAGVMVLARENPLDILYRSHEPVLTPETPEECSGTIANVVFPTGIDRRDDLGSRNRFDIYYGMADDRIGAARFDMPDLLDAYPHGGSTHRRVERLQSSRT